MKFNKWTMALVAAGVVSLPAVVNAEEAANQVMTALSATTLSGYVDTSASWRLGNNTGPIPGRSFDGAGKQDGFNLNVVGLTLEKPLDEGTWAAGYKVDLVFGPDADYYGTTLGGAGVGGGDGGDFNVKQAYAAFRAPVGNGIDFKMGVFDTVVGYEVFESGNNPNFSRSYGYAIEPTHHTGAIASYHVNDMISIAGGVANTWGGTVNQRLFDANGQVQSQKTLLGAITLTLPDSAGFLAGSAIYAGVVDGRILTSANDSTSYYVGQTLATPLEGLAIGAAFDYRDGGTGAHHAVPLGAPDNWAWAAAVYASYQATEKLRLNLRGEWARGSDGTFYDGGAQGASDEQNELTAVTATLDYALWSGLITRLEGRWDHAIGGDRPFAGLTTGAPGMPDSDNNVFTVALNMVYKF